MPASRAAAFAELSEPQPRQISRNDELSESKPAEPVLMLTAGRKG